MFYFKNKELYVDNVPARDIIEKYGTPIYVYSASGIRDRLKQVFEFTEGIDSLILLAMKANSNISLLKFLSSWGIGADAVSGGELYLALKAGIPQKKIVFNGNGKDAWEIELAVRSNILLINVENVEEVELIDSIARRYGRVVDIGFRWNPEIEVPTHPYLATALKRSKFGLSSEEIFSLVKEMNRYPNVRLVGLHAHIGSQITAVEPYVILAGAMAKMVKRLRTYGFDIRYVDLGGGWGISYNRSSKFPLKSFLDSVKSVVDGEYKVVFEPGRWLLADAGIILSKVLYIKNRYGKRMVILDMGMNDLVRPSMYGAKHGVAPISTDGGVHKYDFVGPVCESGDVLREGILTYNVKRGDYVAVFKAGAYGFSMSSNYNMRLRPAEVLVDGDRYYLIRKREEFDDLIRKQVF